MRVEDRSGRRWRVRRRWSPWRRRIRDVPDTPDVHGLGDDPISAVIGIFLLILAIPAIVVVLLLLAELLLLLALLPFFVLIRLLLPVPWTLELWSRPVEQRFLGWHLEHEVRVKGWKASQDRLRSLAAEVAALRPRDDWQPEGRTGPEAVRGGGTPPSRKARRDDNGATAEPDRAGAPHRPDTAGTATPATDAPAASPRRAGDGSATPNPFAQRDD